MFLLTVFLRLLPRLSKRHRLFLWVDMLLGQYEQVAGH